MCVHVIRVCVGVNQKWRHRIVVAEAELGFEGIRNILISFTSFYNFSFMLYFFEFNFATNVCLAECYVKYKVTSSVVPHGSLKGHVVSNGKAKSTMVLMEFSYFASLLTFCKD